MIKRYLVIGASTVLLLAPAGLCQEDSLSKARDYLLAGKYTELESLAKSMLKDNPSDFSAMEFLAESYFRRGQVTQALEIYEEAERATKLLAKRLDAKLLQCREYISEKQFIDASDLLKQKKTQEALLLAKKSMSMKDSAYTHMLVSLIYSELGMTQDATLESKKAVQLDPTLKLDLDPEERNKRYLETLNKLNESKKRQEIPADLVHQKPEI